MRNDGILIGKESVKYLQFLTPKRNEGNPGQKIRYDPDF